MGAPGISGAVLAGGQGRRMGRPKSGLLVGREPLLLRQLRLLREAGVGERFVSLEPGGQPGFALESDIQITRDPCPNLGPLGGIGQVLQCASNPRVLILAVDLPEMTSEYLQGLWAACADGRGIIPRLDGRLEPLVAVYPRSLHPEAADRVARGDLALRDFARAAVAAGAMTIREVEHDQAVLFTNWNRPTDFAPQ